jgi:Protein of unknown function (DUF3515)
VAGCSGQASPVAVTLPTTSASATACAALATALPSSLEGRHRRTTSPASGRVTAWGSPAVVLRCGVPAVTTDTGDQVTINGIGWRTPGEEGDMVLWTTTGLAPAVELSVPSSVTDQENLLTDLATALTTALSRVPGPASTAATRGGSGPTTASAPSAGPSSG